MVRDVFARGEVGEHVIVLRRLNSSCSARGQVVDKLLPLAVCCIKVVAAGRVSRCKLCGACQCRDPKAWYALRSCQWVSLKLVEHDVHIEGVMSAHSSHQGTSSAAGREI